MKHTLLLIATAASLATLGTASADSVLSPKAQALADSFRATGSGSADTIDRSVAVGSPKSRAWSESLRKVSGSDNAADLAHGPSPTMSPKDPNYNAALLQLRSKEFHVAPLK
jgi:hypothetical protein